MTEKEAKATISKLIEKYEQVVASNKLKSYTEEETKKDFILPLFKVLGWDVDDKNEVSAEEHIRSAGRLDYGFYLDGWPKFYLEAKALKADLNSEVFAKQAIRYSWNKGVTWAVLTDFESIKVFNAQDIGKYLADKLYFEIPFTEYIERFDQLWLLSKTAFQQNQLDLAAEKVGKKLQRVSVTDSLYQDLSECRSMLMKSLSLWNPKVEPELLDEGIQKLLDRLIFLRVAEDRKLEPPTLIPMIRAWSGSDNNRPLYESMVDKFRELDEIYDSGLFGHHPFEKWEEYDGTTEKVIEKLYGKKNYYEYDFKDMPADILGNVYENYLGYQLSQSQKGVSVSKDAKKRKEQGIYYTPTHIVNYIVDSALRPVLDKCKSINDLKQVKVLDPACGSGSFLIKALEVLTEKYREFGYKDNELTKIQILTQNLYGVDLDEKAVEIARLNLLVNSLDQRMKLPSLNRNIKNGNSLISGDDKELEKYFGKDFDEKKPFNWKEEFPEVFDRKNPGFDVVIGNPPYIDSESMVKTMPEDRNYINSKFVSATGNWDIFCVFIEQALNLCRTNGYHSFIVPNKLMSARYALSLRSLIRETQSLMSIRDYSKLNVFNVSVYPIVFVIQKNKPAQKIVIETVNEKAAVFSASKLEVSARQFYSNEEWVTHSIIDSKLLDKIGNGDKTIPLSELAFINGAATVSEAYSLKTFFEDKPTGQLKIVNSGTIDRYRSLWGSKPMKYLGLSLLNPTISKDKLRENTSANRLEQAVNGKIVLAGMTRRIECFLDENGKYSPAKSTTIVRPKIEPLVVLALLNSKLITYFISNKFRGNKLQGGYIRLGPPEVKEIPIPRYILEKGIEPELVQLATKISRLNAKLQDNEQGTSQWNHTMSEIEKTDRQIDNIVYGLYGINSNEAKVIEEAVQ